MADTENSGPDAAELLVERFEQLVWSLGCDRVHSSVESSETREILITALRATPAPIGSAGPLVTLLSAVQAIEHVGGHDRPGRVDAARAMLQRVERPDSAHPANPLWTEGPASRAFHAQTMDAPPKRDAPSEYRVSVEPMETSSGTSYFVCIDHPSRPLDAKPWDKGRMTPSWHPMQEEAEIQAREWREFFAGTHRGIGPIIVEAMRNGR